MQPFRNMPPAVRLQLWLAYWQNIFFGQLTEISFNFFGFCELNLDYDRSFIEKKKKKQDGLRHSLYASA